MKFGKLMESTAKDYISAIKKYSGDLEDVSTPNDLEELLIEARGDKIHRGLRNFFNFLEEQDVDFIGEFPLSKWRKKCKIPQYGAKEIHITDEELRKAYSEIKREEIKLIFELMVFSGVRLKHIIRALNSFNPQDVVVVNEKVHRYPAFRFSRGSKKSYWIYFPATLELKKLEIRYDVARDETQIGRVSANTIRKWNFNFLIMNGVPESVADFIQGRASTTVGSAHYLAKTVQADNWYSKVVDKLLRIIS
ncbi:MAG: integrase [Archaeoglobaceae archaeon]